MISSIYKQIDVSEWNMYLHIPLYFRICILAENFNPFPNYLWNN